jgi:hypothetical protein
MFRHFFKIITIVMIVISPAQKICAAEIEALKEDDLSVITLEGDLIEGDDKKFIDIALANPNALVVFHSNGGNLFSGIEIGKAIRLKGYTTLVPDEMRCASACALAWLGGRVRAMGTTAQVGFHAASNINDGKVTSAGNALVGAYLSQLGLPSAAVVYITEPPPDSIRWLTAADAQQYGIDVKVLSLPDKQNAADAPDKKKSAGKRRQQADSGLENRAIAAVEQIYRDMQNPNDRAMRTLSALYADEVLYFGKNVDRSQIIKDKENYLNRWPQRVYNLDNEQLYVSCLGKSCTVNGMIDWVVVSRERNARANGTASFSYTIDLSAVSPLIVAETSTVVKREASAGSAAGNAPRAISGSEKGALDVVTRIFDISSRDNAQTRAFLTRLYADMISYYGKTLSKKTVLSDKFKFLERWPTRAYRPDLGSIETSCAEKRCRVRGIVQWVTEAPSRSAHASGQSRFTYIIDLSGKQPLIIGEEASNL